MGIPDYITFLLRNLYAGQEATVRTRHGKMDWFQIEKGVSQGSILLLCLLNLYAVWWWWLCPTIVTPWTVAWQTSLSMGFSRQEYWSELLFPSPGDLPNPGIEPGSPALQADSLPTEVWGKTSWKMLGCMKHKLESRLLGEISVTSDMQMIAPLWQKVKRN